MNTVSSRQRYFVVKKKIFMIYTQERTGSLNKAQTLVFWRAWGSGDPVPRNFPNISFKICVLTLYYNIVKKIFKLTRQLM